MGVPNEYPLAIAIYVGMICSGLKLDLQVFCQLGWDDWVGMSQNGKSMKEYD